MTYKIFAVFERDEFDDAGVLHSSGQPVTREALLQQLRKELQDAYDEGNIAGNFDLLRVEITDLAMQEAEAEAAR